MKNLIFVLAVLLVAPNVSFAGEEMEAPLLEKKAAKKEAPKQAQISTEMEDAWGGDDKIKTAIMELAPAGVESGIAKSLTGVVAKEIDKMGAFKVIGLEDIKMLIDLEQQKQMMGCNDTSCMAEIGGALGAELFVQGSVGKLGDTFLLNLQVIRVEDARVESRVSREIKGDMSRLIKETRTAAKLLMRDILQSASGQLIVRTDEEGATVKIDGQIIGSTPMAMIEVAGGVHTMDVEKKGFITWRKDVEIKQNEPTIISVTLIPSAEYIREYESRAGAFRTLGWVGVATGGAILAGGAAVYFMGLSKKSEVDTDMDKYNLEKQDLLIDEQQGRWDEISDKNDTVSKYNTFGIVGIGVGAALATAGIILFTTGEAPDRYREFSGGALSKADDTKKSTWTLNLHPSAFSLSAIW